jgi:hypothetical protein
MIYAADAVNSLRPNTEWIMKDDDVDNIVWHTEGVKPISSKELQDEMARLEALEAQKPVLKAQLLNRLGITAEEAVLLLSK